MILGASDRIGLAESQPAATPNNGPTHSVPNPNPQSLRLDFVL